LDGIYVQDARLEYNDWSLHIFKLFRIYFFIFILIHKLIFANI
jgi:hypothetical protein